MNSKKILKELLSKVNWARIGRSLLVSGILILVFLVPMEFHWLGELTPYANVAGAYALVYGTLLYSLCSIGVGVYLMKRK